MAQMFMGWTKADDPGLSVGDLVDQRKIWVAFEAPQHIEDSDDDVPLPVWISLAKAPSGKLYCDGLIMGDLHQHRFKQRREINAARLREVSIPYMVAAAVRSGEMPDSYGDMVRELLSELPGGRPPARGPRGYPDEHFEEVAALYRRALIEDPRSPTKWLAEHYSTSLPTARRWIQRARDRGHLGASTPGKAGEQPGPNQEDD